MEEGQEDLSVEDKYWLRIKGEKQKVAYLEKCALSDNSTEPLTLPFEYGEKEHLLRITCSFATPKPDVIQLLINNGANVKSKDLEGKDALALFCKACCEYGEEKDVLAILKALVKAGASVHRACEFIESTSAFKDKEWVLLQLYAINHDDEFSFRLDLLKYSSATKKKGYTECYCGLGKTIYIDFDQFNCEKDSKSLEAELAVGALARIHAGDVIAYKELIMMVDGFAPVVISRMTHDKESKDLHTVVSEASSASFSLEKDLADALVSPRRLVKKKGKNKSPRVSPRASPRVSRRSTLSEPATTKAESDSAKKIIQEIDPVSYEKLRILFKLLGVTMGKFVLTSTTPERTKRGVICTSFNTSYISKDRILGDNKLLSLGEKKDKEISGKVISDEGRAFIGGLDPEADIDEWLNNVSAMERQRTLLLSLGRIKLVRESGGVRKSTVVRRNVVQLDAKSRSIPEGVMVGFCDRVLFVKKPIAEDVRLTLRGFFELTLEKSKKSGNLSKQSGAKTLRASGHTFRRHLKSIKEVKKAFGKFRDSLRGIDKIISGLYVGRYDLYLALELPSLRQTVMDRVVFAKFEKRQYLVTFIKYVSFDVNSFRAFNLSSLSSLLSAATLKDQVPALFLYPIQLANLDLSDTSSVDNKTLKLIGEKCKSLVSLSLRGNPDITSCEDLKFQHLRKLDMSGTSIKYFEYPDNNKLTDLMLEFCLFLKYVTADGENMTSLSTKGSNLQRISLSDGKKIFSLTHLNVERCAKLLEVAIDAPNLVYFNTNRAHVFQVANEVQVRLLLAMILDSAVDKSISSEHSGFCATQLNDFNPGFFRITCDLYKDNALFRNTRMEGADLTDVQANNMRLEGVGLQNAILPNANFSNSDLSRAKLNNIVTRLERDLDKKKVSAMHGSTESSDECTVSTMTFSPDGSQFATAGKDSSVSVWDAKMLEPVRRITTEGTPQCLVFSHDGKMLAIDNGDMRIKICDFKKEEEFVLEWVDDGKESLSKSNDGKFGFYQNIVSVTDSNDEVINNVMRAINEEGLASKFNSSVDATKKVLSQDNQIRFIAFDNKNQYVIYSDNFGDLVFEKIDGTGRNVIKLSSIVSISSMLINDENQLVVADVTGNIQILDIEKRRSLAKISAHDARISSMKLMPDGRLITASDDGKIKFWSVSFKNKALKIKCDETLTFKHPICYADIGRGGKSIIYIEQHFKKVGGSQENSNSVLEKANCAFIRNLMPNKDGHTYRQMKLFACSGDINAGAKSIDQKWLMLGLSDGAVKCFQVYSEFHKQDKGGVPWFRVDGTNIHKASMSKECHTSLLRMRAVEKQTMIDSHCGQFFVYNDDKTNKIDVHDFRDGSIRVVEKAKTGLISFLAVDSEAKQIAICCPDGSIQAWDGCDGTAVGNISRNNNCDISMLKFTPKGNLITVSAGQKVIKLWKMNYDKQKMIFVKTLSSDDPRFVGAEHCVPVKEDLSGSKRQLVQLPEKTVNDGVVPRKQRGRNKRTIMQKNSRSLILDRDSRLFKRLSKRVVPPTDVVEKDAAGLTDGLNELKN